MANFGNKSVAPVTGRADGVGDVLLLLPDEFDEPEEFEEPLLLPDPIVTVEVPSALQLRTLVALISFLTAFEELQLYESDVVPSFKAWKVMVATVPAVETDEAVSLTSPAI